MSADTPRFDFIDSWNPVILTSQHLKMLERAEQDEYCMSLDVQNFKALSNRQIHQIGKKILRRVLQAASTHGFSFDSDSRLKLSVGKDNLIINLIEQMTYLYTVRPDLPMNSKIRIFFLRDGGNLSAYFRLDYDDPDPILSAAEKAQMFVAPQYPSSADYTNVMALIAYESWNFSTEDINSLLEKLATKRIRSEEHITLEEVLLKASEA